MANCKNIDPSTPTTVKLNIANTTTAIETGITIILFKSAVRC